MPKQRLRRLPSSAINHGIAILLLASVPAHAEENLRIYTKGTVTRPKGSFELKISDIARIGKSSGDYAFHDIRPEFEYGITDRLTVGFELMLFDHDYSVDDPELNPMYETQQEHGGRFDQGRLTVRTRQEIRTFTNRRTQSRNRLRIQWQQTPHNRRFKPFISNEWFYDVDHGTFTRTRWDVGLNLPPYGRISTKIFYKVVVNRDQGFDARQPSVGVHLAVR